MGKISDSVYKEEKINSMKILFVIYDNASQFSNFPLGTAYLVSILSENGYNNIDVYNQDIYHYPDEHLTEILNRNHYDVIGIGIIGGYYQYKKLLKICNAINKSKDRPIIILGGHGPSPEPEYFMKKTKADFVIIGEAEIPIVNLVNEITGSRDYHKVNGIAYWNNDNEIKINKREKPIKDLDAIPLPDLEHFPIDAYASYKPAGAIGPVRSMPVLTCRGCMYQCNFCVTGDTKISLNNSYKEIKNIKIGDKIKGYNIKNKKISNTIVNDIHKRIGDTYNIIIEGGDNINISGEHPIYTKRGWIKVKNLTEDDYVLKEKIID